MCVRCASAVTESIEGGHCDRASTSPLRARPDVLYINQYLDSLFASTVARLLRIPLVCHLRLFPPDWFCGQWRIGLTGVSRFIAVSEATRRAYVERGFDPNAIELVLNGVDVDRFRPLADRAQLREGLGLTANQFAVLYVGRIDHGKNLETLLRAFADVVATARDARLLIAGRPLVHNNPNEGARYLADLETAAARLGITPNVQWLGPRTDVVQLYNAADACVLPSAAPETFGRTLAEAMACGTPGVGTAVGGIPEVLIGDAARFIVPPGDHRAMTACLRELVDWRRRDPSLGARMRALAVEHFDSRRMVRGVAAVLERSVAEGSVRRGPRHLGSVARSGAGTTATAPAR